MGKATKRQRQSAIKKQHHKMEKISKLKQKYQNADARAREELLAKIKKLSPDYPESELAKGGK